MEAIQQTFNGTADFGKRVSCTIARNGDLIHKIYLQVDIPSVSISGSSFRWIDSLGHYLINTVELQIGGQRIDMHYGDWLEIWNELTLPTGLKAGYNRMIGNTLSLTSTENGDTGAGSADTVEKPQTTLYIPLQFFFCRNPGLALPLIALQYHEVVINLEFNRAANCYIVGTDGQSPVPTMINPNLQNASLYVDYIYLDTDERRRFAQVSHEYLIEQLQFTGEETFTGSTYKARLNFNHPCKELVWVVQRTDAVDNGQNQWTNFTTQVALKAYDTENYNTTGTNAFSGFPTSTSAVPGLSNAGLLYGRESGSANMYSGEGNGNLTNAGTGMLAVYDNGPGVLGAWPGYPYGITPSHVFGGPGAANCVWAAKLLLNGHDRFSERRGDYFNLVQPYQHHTNIPDSVGINVYSFALSPENHQPSGTCNMSRIDNATLHLSVHPDIASASLTKKLRVYATNYNVLRIMSGMGGLLQITMFIVIFNIKGPKSITQLAFGKLLFDNSFRHPMTRETESKSDTSNCETTQLRHYKIVRETPKIKPTKVCSERTNWPRKTLGYSKNGLNEQQNAVKWAIRSHVSTVLVLPTTMRKVQRLNGNGSAKSGLRYSLLPNKYTERWGIKVPIPTKRITKIYLKIIKNWLNHRML